MRKRRTVRFYYFTQIFRIIEKELAEYKVKNPYITEGNNVVTRPGSLRTTIKFVIHAVGPTNVS